MTWRTLFRRADGDRQLDAELRDHLERAIRDRIRAGTSEAEARRLALAEFGGMANITEQCRDARGTRWLGDFAADLRYATRVLRASPAFTVVAVLSLALGIGANTAIFSLVNAVLMRPLPVPAPHELVLVAERIGARSSLPFSTQHFHILDDSDAFKALCAFRPWPLRVTTASGSELVKGQLLSDGCSTVFDVRALLGRTLAKGDEQSAVISHDYWRRAFGGDPGVLGRPIVLQGQPYTIVGVTPPGFFGARVGYVVDVSVPLSSERLVMSGPVPPGNRWLYLLGRLAPGVSREQGQARLTATWDRIAGGPGPYGHELESRLEALPGAQGSNELGPQFSRPLGLLAMGVGVLLALGCVNLAGLLLARAQARQQEVALRLALGASRGRVVRQLLTESFVLAGIGGCAGGACAIWGSAAIVAILSRGRPSPIAIDVTPDPAVIAFTVVTSVLAGLLFGSWPAWRATRDSARELSRSMSRASAPRAGLTLVVAAQVALSLVLVAAAGLFVRSVVNLKGLDLGFERNRLLVAVINPDVGGYHGEIGRRIYQDLYERLARLPGVQSATMSMDMPLESPSYTAGVSVASRSLSQEASRASFNYVGPRFFETMRIPLVAGRDFIDGDAAGSAIVSESAARAWFPKAPVIGQRFRRGRDLFEIVGVAKNVRYDGVHHADQHVVYLPYLGGSADWGALTFALRSDLGQAALGDEVRAAVHAAAPDLPVSSLTMMDAAFDLTIATERILATLSSFFGIMALLLVGIGVYGTLAYGVARRRREIGVRAALGADRRALVRLLLGGALAPVAAGLVAGVPLAIATTRVARSSMFGVSTADPLTYATAALLLLLVALVAAYLPARRASRLDPMSALRQE